ncbi:Acyl-lipid (8-3)-desaturase [Pseudolycoriella hygida]|uniref:Acyl-lipid (8-3)-desaturase n=1 Tax=Pseudolycoriella hygida TaxID=35572 RepID=A0A9Q0NB73_9DIPT|nr:Acyl-lipid (8-3)-desaturase [Pseudolycoriella hygida]
MNKKEILIDGYYYDVADFIKKHPGGSIIEYYTKSGEDATLAVQQFHLRSMKRVTGIMSSLKKRPAPENEIQLDPATLKKNRALTEDFTKLYLELEREGYFKPSYVHIAYRLVELLLMSALGAYLSQIKTFWVQIVAVFVCGITAGRSGWVQHEGGHYSLTGNPKIDRYLQILTIGLGLGQSATWWRRGHNRHHAMPQRLKHDVDLDTMPLLAYNAKVVKNREAGRSFMVQYQVYLFVLIDMLVGGLLWQLYLHPRYVWKHKLYLEMATMIIHHAILINVEIWQWVLGSWITAVYLFLNFALNHSFMPVTTEPTHWVEYSFLHTADVEQRPWCDWWMSYLNYQIEHHLFPTMPQFRHPLIKDRVKALAEKHNIPYVVNSYSDAVRKTFKNLADVAKEVKEM